MYDSKVKLMLKIAESQLGKPYEYKSNGAGSFDCSGFICELLKSAGLLSKVDLSAQGLHDLLFNNHAAYKIACEHAVGDLCFYGANRISITHVNMLFAEIGRFYIIEAGGGDSTTTTPQAAKALGAMVRIRPLTWRHDLIAVMDPFHLPAI